jgi:hypothetical protein
MNLGEFRFGLGKAHQNCSEISISGYGNTRFHKNQHSLIKQILFKSIANTELLYQTSFNNNQLYGLQYRTSFLLLSKNVKQADSSQEKAIQVLGYIKAGLAHRSLAERDDNGFLLDVGTMFQTSQYIRHNRPLISIKPTLGYQLYSSFGGDINHRVNIGLTIFLLYS